MDSRTESWTSSEAGSRPSAGIDPEIERDLRAAIAALRELGPGYEQELVNSFLDRLDETARARNGGRIAGPAIVRPTRLARAHRHGRFRRMAFGAAALFAFIFFAHAGGAHHGRFYGPRFNGGAGVFQSAPPAPPVPPAPPAPPAPTF